jgi:hypothetical protein
MSVDSEILETGLNERRDRRAESRRRVVRRRRRLWALGVLALLLSPVVYSYVTTIVRPSSVPLGIRSVEWLRAHGGAPAVDEAERLYYSWKAPRRGGPALRTLPKVGSATPLQTEQRGVRLPSRVAPAIQPRLAGEGVWRRTGPLVAGAPPLLVTTFRTDPTYPQIVGYVVWIDHTRTQLALYPGRYEPPAAAPRGPMQVPYGERWRLLATFNSGFTYKDGHGGFAVSGHVFEPLRPGDATLVGYRNGRVDVVAWQGGPNPPRNVVVARQNLPLIVDHGRPSPALGDGPAWGATLGNAIRVWRSGVGVDRQGNLLYAAANYQTVASLADILIRAGAVRAMQLDINAEWPSFNAYGLGGGRNARQIVPNTQQTASRYLVPDDRDFFAVLRRK